MINKSLRFQVERHCRIAARFADCGMAVSAVAFKGLPSSRDCPMQRIFLPACLLIALGCSPSATSPPKADAPPAQPTHDGDALTGEEKIVRAFILDNADDPKSVEFARWGPNVSGEQLRALIKQAHDNLEAAERAKWEEGKKLHDADVAKWREEKAKEDATTVKYEAAVAKAKAEAAHTKPVAGFAPPLRVDAEPPREIRPEPRPYPDFVALPGAFSPPFLSDTGEIDMLVRVRLRGNNRMGAKELLDGVFSVQKHNKVTPWPLSHGGDDWWEAQKALWTTK
jgi:hypothetical protein